MKTIRGIELNLKESDYKTSFQGLTFYFSSELYLNKFKDNFQNYIKSESERIKAKYRINITNDIFLAIAYYKKIEKRGFRIVDENNKKEITENINFLNIIIKY